MHWKEVRTQKREVESQLTKMFLAIDLVKPGPRDGIRGRTRAVKWHEKFATDSLRAWMSEMRAREEKKKWRRMALVSRGPTGYQARSILESLRMLQRHRLRVRSSLANSLKGRGREVLAVPSAESSALLFSAANAYKTRCPNEIRMQ